MNQRIHSVPPSVILADLTWFGYGRLFCSLLVPLKEEFFPHHHSSYTDLLAVVCSYISKGKFLSILIALCSEFLKPHPVVVSIIFEEFTYF